MTIVERMRDPTLALRPRDSDTAVWFGVRMADGRRATDAGDFPPLTDNDYDDDEELKLTRLRPAKMGAPRLVVDGQLRLSRLRPGTMGTASSFCYFLAPVPGDSLKWSSPGRRVTSKSRRS